MLSLPDPKIERAFGGIPQKVHVNPNVGEIQYLTITLRGRAGYRTIDNQRGA